MRGKGGKGADRSSNAPCLGGRDQKGPYAATGGKRGPKDRFKRKLIYATGPCGTQPFTQKAPIWQQPRTVGKPI